jgi:hypothetical protein
MPTDDPIAILEARRIKREQERMEINKRLSQLNAEGEEDTIALRVLRRILSSNGDAEKTNAESLASRLSPVVNVSGSLAAMVQASGGMLVKDMIIAILRDAGPDGLTATQIKGRAALRYKANINPNTLTVSLVRASKPKGEQAPLVRCAGRIWYYIGQPEAPNVRSPELALNGGTAAVLNG